MFSFENGQNVIVLDTNSSLYKDDLYFYKTLYCKVVGNEAKLPNVTITYQEYNTTLPGEPLAIKELNPPANFCNVLANDLTIVKSKSVQFNKELNLVVLKLEGNLSNLEDFSLPFAKKEEIKDINRTLPTTSMIYYAFVPSDITQLKFSYFNLQAREFKPIFFDIKVKDEIVSTQSDISPEEDKNKSVKIILFASFGALLLLIAFWKRSLFTGFVGLISLVYAGYLLLPLEKVCLKAGSKIYILPTTNSTIFRINKKQNTFTKLNEVDGYTKIELQNNKIGWVKNEDLCKN